MGYCPKCKSQLYPDDQQYIAAAGVCGYCVTWDKQDGQYKQAWARYLEYQAQLTAAASKPKKRRK